MGIVASVSVHLGVLVIAKDPAYADLAAVEVVAERAAATGHRVIARHAVADSEAAIRSQLARWFDDREVDVVIILSGESEVVSKAVAPLVTEVLPGFTDLFRWLAFQESGASAMLSPAEAARCGSTFVFVVPGAIAAAMDKLILPQFDPATTPRNLVDQLPRLRAKPVDAVPEPIVVEKTQGGPGLPARLPAVQPRDRPRTGANVIARGAGKVPDDPATRPIDVARLERQLAESAGRPHEDVTRPDLALVLPRLPPGAVAEPDDDDELDSDDDHTATDTVAVQPAPPLPPPASPTALKPRSRGPDDARARPPTAPPRTGPVPTVAKPGAASSPAASRESKPFSFSTPVRGGTTAAPPSRSSVATPSAGAPSVSARGAARSSAATPSGGAPAPTAPAPSSTPAPQRSGSSTPPPVATRASVWVTTPRPAQATKPPAASAASPATSTTTPRPAPTTRPPAAHPVAADSAAASTAVVPARIATEPGVAAPAVGAMATRPTEAAPRILAPETLDTGRLDTDVDSMGAETLDADPDATETLDAEPVDDSDADAARADAARTRQPTPSPPAPMSYVSTVDAPRTRQPTPPPPAPMSYASTVDAPRMRQPTPPPPVPVPVPVRGARTPTVPPPVNLTDNDLPRGAFAYPVQPRRGNLVLKLVAAVAAVVIGFFAVVYVLDKKDEPSTKVATGTPPPPLDAATAGSAIERGSNEPAALATGSAATGTTTTDTAATGTPATGSATSTGTPATGTPATGTPATGTPAASTSTPRPRPGTPTPRPQTGSAAGSAATAPITTTTATAGATPPVDAAVEEPDLCDEANCVLSDYDRPCCAKYKAKGPELAQRVGGVPETLDRSMVRAGVESIKPRVIACGEKTGAKGTVKIAVAVSPAGAVTSAEVTDAPDAALGTCVVGALRSAKFGKSVEGGSFSYPFVF